MLHYIKEIKTPKKLLLLLLDRGMHASFFLSLSLSSLTFHDGADGIPAAGGEGQANTLFKAQVHLLLLLLCDDDDDGGGGGGVLSLTIHTHTLYTL